MLVLPDPWLGMKLIVEGKVARPGNCGHAPFWENAAEFNRRLCAFAEGI